MAMQLTLAVADLDRSQAFYGGLLGLWVERMRPARQFAEFLCLHIGEKNILLRHQEDLAETHPALFEPLNRYPKGLGVSLEIDVANLSAIVRHLDQWQIHALYELEDAEHRRRELWLHDPDGYLLMLVEETDDEGK